MKLIVKNSTIEFQSLNIVVSEVTVTVTNKETVPENIAVGDTFTAESYNYNNLQTADLSGISNITKIKIYKAFAKHYLAPYFVLTDENNQVLYVSEKMPKNQSGAQDIEFTIPSIEGTVKYLYASMTGADIPDHVDVTYIASE